jgi:RNA polymerase sigma-70 factor (ECF subfamily)
MMPELTVLDRTVNGRPGLVATHDDVAVTVAAFDVEGDRITRIWAVRNPEKLTSWSSRGRS